MISRVKSSAPKLPPATPDVVSVLIVDDEEPVARFVHRVLKEVGFKTMVARSGAEAIGIVEKSGGIDILVTDVMMPQMCGDEVARRLRQSEPELKVLYLTGYSDALFKEKVTLWDGEAFLDKPCSVKGLVQAVSLLMFGSFEPPRPADAV
jgi:CheY-like chemotaxis protein